MKGLNIEYQGLNIKWLNTVISIKGLNIGYQGSPQEIKVEWQYVVAVNGGVLKAHRGLGESPRSF